MASRNVMIGAAVVVAAAVVAAIVVRMEQPPPPVSKSASAPAPGTPPVAKPTVIPSTPAAPSAPVPADPPKATEKAPVTPPHPLPPASTAPAAPPEPSKAAEKASEPAPPPAKSAGDQPAGAPVMTLALPEDAKPGEPIDLHVTLGALPARALVHVKSVADGATLATIYPFGRPPGEDAGTFVVSIPVAAAKDGKLEVRFEIEAGGSVRPATTPDGAVSIVKGAKLETPPIK